MRRLETGRRLVERIDDHHRESNRAGALERPLQRIDEKNRAQMLSLVLRRHGQPTDQRGAHQRIARDVFAGCLRHVAIAQRV